MHGEISNHLTAGIALACDMLTLVGAHGAEQERAKLHAVLLVSAPPACRAFLTLQNALKKGFST